MRTGSSCASATSPRARTPTGRRQYSRAVLSRAKGRAKSEIAGFVGLFEAFGPCRFAGWAEGGETYRWHGFTYTYAPGEPMGHPLTYPYIRCLATEESQTGNTYDVIHFNLTKAPEESRWYFFNQRSSAAGATPPPGPWPLWSTRGARP